MSKVRKVKAPNYIRVRLDVVLNIPGENCGPLLDVSLTKALLIGLGQLGVRVESVHRGYRHIDSCDATGKHI